MNEKNINNKSLKPCSMNPITGYHRDGYCRPNMNDRGKHNVCATMNKEFMNFTASRNNDLSSVVKPGENWCLCQDRWEEAYNANKAPEIIEEATHIKAKSMINRTLRRNGGKKKRKSLKRKNKYKKKSLKRKNKYKKNPLKKTKKKLQFLYNPDDPKKSFDVYINKNPSDTIPIKYTTVNDVKSTIKKLERLYKTKKYPHKRIWQVGMILKVRLEAMKKHKKTKYPNAKYVNERFNIANKYFKFLGKRSKVNTFTQRKKLKFNF